MKNKETYNSYINDGYKIEIYDSKIIIIYKNKKYEINIIEDDNQLCFCLTPYNQSSFITNIHNGLEIVLFAIKENEKLYITEKD